MTIINETEREYRFDDSGPKSLLRGPRLNFGVVVLQPGQDFTAHYHNIMEENFFILKANLKSISTGKSSNVNKATSSMSSRRRSTI